MGKPLSSSSETMKWLKSLHITLQCIKKYDGLLRAFVTSLAAWQSGVKTYWSEFAFQSEDCTQYSVGKYITYFKPMFHFHSLWKQKYVAFLFSRGIEMKYWRTSLMTEVQRDRDLHHESVNTSSSSKNISLLHLSPVFHKLFL